LSSPPLVFLFFRSFPSCIRSFIPFSLYYFFYPLPSPLIHGLSSAFIKP
jgi:hypothetical protein